MNDIDHLIAVLRHCGNPNVSCKGCPDIDDCYGAQGAWEIGAEANMRSAAEAIDALCEVIPRRCECCVGCELEKEGGYCDTGFILSPVRATAFITYLMEKYEEVHYED